MFKEIQGYEHYLVSDEGEIYSLRSNKILKPDIDKDGYEIYRISDEEHKRKAFKGHRLVGLTFIENPDNLPIVNHIDGNKRNNHVSNLEWCTDEQNIQHAVKTGLMTPYTRWIEIYDIFKECVVSRFNSYDDLANITGLSKPSLIDMVHRDKLLYEGFKIIRVNTKFIDDDLLDKQFINRTINGRFKPLTWNNLIFASQADFKEHIGCKNIQKQLKIMQHQNKTITYITQYEYVTY